VGTQEMTTTPYTRLVTNISQLKEFEIELFAYNGTVTPKWLLDAYGTSYSCIQLYTYSLSTPI
jgi:hypothetical protein